MSHPCISGYLFQDISGYFRVFISGYFRIFQGIFFRVFQGISGPLAGKVLCCCKSCPMNDQARGSAQSQPSKVLQVRLCLAHAGCYPELQRQWDEPRAAPSPRARSAI